MIIPVCGCGKTHVVYPNISTPVEKTQVKSLNLDGFGKFFPKCSEKTHCYTETIDVFHRCQGHVSNDGRPGNRTSFQVSPDFSKSSEETRFWWVLMSCLFWVFSPVSGAIPGADAQAQQAQAQAQAQAQQAQAQAQQAQAQQAQAQQAQAQAQAAQKVTYSVWAVAVLDYFDIIWVAPYIFFAVLFIALLIDDCILAYFCVLLSFSSLYYSIFLYIIADWWFGTWILFSNMLGMSSSQLTFIFFRGVGQPPTNHCILLFLYHDSFTNYVHHSVPQTPSIARGGRRRCRSCTDRTAVGVFGGPWRPVGWWGEAPNVEESELNNPELNHLNLEKVKKIITGYIVLNNLDLKPDSDTLRWLGG